jgi:hypothetical protein
MSGNEALKGFVIGSLLAASLSDPTKASGAAGGVDLVENGVRITVSGNGKIPLPDLIAVAESLQPLPAASVS